MGRALVNYVLLMDPELILIGGGMAAPARHCSSRSPVCCSARRQALYPE